MMTGVQSIRCSVDLKFQCFVFLIVRAAQMNTSLLYCMSLIIGWLCNVRA